MVNTMVEIEILETPVMMADWDDVRQPSSRENLVVSQHSDPLEHKQERQDVTEQVELNRRELEIIQLD